MINDTERTEWFPHSFFAQDEQNWLLSFSYFRIDTQIGSTSLTEHKTFRTLDFLDFVYFSSKKYKSVIKTKTANTLELFICHSNVIEMAEQSKREWKFIRD